MSLVPFAAFYLGGVVLSVVILLVGYTITTGKNHGWRDR